MMRQLWLNFVADVLGRSLTTDEYHRLEDAFYAGFSSAVLKLLSETNNPPDDYVALFSEMVKEAQGYSKALEINKIIYQKGLKNEVKS